MYGPRLRSFFFFFNDTATTEIYTLSLHDALPISMDVSRARARRDARGLADILGQTRRHATEIPGQDRKSTRLNSSHSQISYAVFCLKKKKHQRRRHRHLHPRRRAASDLTHSLPPS